MKTLLHLVLIACLANGSLAFADESSQKYNQISFNVNAESDIANDRLVIVMKAHEQGRNLESLADDVNKTMSWALKTAAKANEIKTQTLNYQTHPNYSKGKQDGWQVSQSLQLSSNNAEALSKLMGQLQSRMQTESVSYQVTPEKQKQLEDKLTTQALQLFTQKAENIARALQRKSYKIVQISLRNNSPVQPRPMARTMMAAESVTAPSLEPGTQKLSVFASGTIEITD